MDLTTPCHLSDTQKDYPHFFNEGMGHGEMERLTQGCRGVNPTPEHQGFSDSFPPQCQGEKGKKKYQLALCFYIFMKYSCSADM